MTADTAAGKTSLFDAIIQGGEKVEMFDPANTSGKQVAIIDKTGNLFVFPKGFSLSGGYPCGEASMSKISSVDADKIRSRFGESKDFILVVY